MTSNSLMTLPPPPQSWINEIADEEKEIIDFFCSAVGELWEIIYKYKRQFELQALKERHDYMILLNSTIRSREVVGEFFSDPLHDLHELINKEGLIFLHNTFDRTSLFYNNKSYIEEYNEYTFYDKRCIKNLKILNNCASCVTSNNELRTHSPAEVNRFLSSKFNRVAVNHLRKIYYRLKGIESYMRGPVDYEKYHIPEYDDLQYKDDEAITKYYKAWEAYKNEIGLIDIEDHLEKHDLKIYKFIEKSFEFLYEEGFKFYKINYQKTHHRHLHCENFLDYRDNSPTLTSCYYTSKPKRKVY